ncbi:MAG: hypothetical protein ACLFNX_04660 [Spirochaetaceae bacterium]
MSRLVVITVAALLLVACGESSLLTPELSEDERVDIETVRDGALLAPNASVPVSVTYTTPDTSTPRSLDHVDIDITDARGTSVGSDRIPGEALEAGDIPPVVLPDLESGRYLLSFHAYRGGERIAVRERTVFIVSDPAAYAISGIAVYPPSLAPKRRGVAQASVSVPEGARAWLRWRLEDEVTFEGYLAEGADQVTLQGPASSGAYVLSLELFPGGRPAGDYRGPAPVTQQSRLIVRSTGGLSSGAIGPRESYFALYHFEGSTEDGGVGGEVTGGRPVEAEPIGNPRLRVSERLFGYELDGSSGFEISGLIAPFRGQALSPFSLNIRLRADALADGMRILTMDGSDSGLRLALRVDRTGLPTLELAGGGTSAESSPREPLFTVGEPLDLSIAVIPGRRATRVRWYAGGRYISESRLPVGFPPAGEDAGWNRRPGSTRLAGENGFTGIIDEFGVYFRDNEGEPAVYTDMFRDARRRELGSTLVYADGFDSADPPEAAVARGSVRTEQGVLILGEGASLTLPAMPFDGDVLVAELDAAHVEGDRPLNVEVSGADGVLFSIDSAGTFEGRAGTSGTVSAGRPLRFRMRRAENGILVRAGADSFTIPLGTSEPGGGEEGDTGEAGPAEGELREVEMRLRGPDEPGVARVESVLVYREAERLAAEGAGEESPP